MSITRGRRCPGRCWCQRSIKWGHSSFPSKRGRTWRGAWWWSRRRLSAESFFGPNGDRRGESNTRRGGAPSGAPSTQQIRRVANDERTPKKKCPHFFFEARSTLRAKKRFSRKPSHRRRPGLSPFARKRGMSPLLPRPVCRDPDSRRASRSAEPLLSAFGGIEKHIRARIRAAYAQPFEAELLRDVRGADRARRSDRLREIDRIVHGPFDARRAAVARHAHAHASAPKQLVEPPLRFRLSRRHEQAAHARADVAQGLEVGRGRAPRPLDFVRGEKPVDVGRRREVFGSRDRLVERVHQILGDRPERHVECVTPIIHL
jgi:hypothetical protein